MPSFLFILSFNLLLNSIYFHVECLWMTYVVVARTSLQFWTVTLLFCRYFLVEFNAIKKWNSLIFFVSIDLSFVRLLSLIVSNLVLTTFIHIFLSPFFDYLGFQQRNFCKALVTRTDVSPFVSNTPSRNPRVEERQKSILPSDLDLRSFR